MDNIKAKEITLIPLASLVEYPKNANKHTPEQIDKLCQLIEHYGFRDALIVDADAQENGQHWVMAGNGRYKAATKLGMELVPVVFQKFRSEDEKYGFMVSHNAIAKDSWAQLDFAQINMDIMDFGPEFDVDLMAIKNFTIEPLDGVLPDLNTDDPQCQQVTFVLSSEQKDILDEAMEKAKKNEDCLDEINQNKNGNILAAILKRYVYG